MALGLGLSVFSWSMRSCRLVRAGRKVLVTPLMAMVAEWIERSVRRIRRSVTRVGSNGLVPHVTRFSIYI